MEGVFFAVHAGAGFIRDDEVGPINQLCKSAIKQIFSKTVNIDRQPMNFNNNNNSTDSAAKICTKLVKYMEDSELTNAGLGSNLTLDKSVECEAAVMQSNGFNFGAVGALKSVKNPVCVAHEVLKLQASDFNDDPNYGNCDSILANFSSPLLIRPNVLVGNGAEKFAAEIGLICIDNSALISQKALREYDIAGRRVEIRSSSDRKRKHMDIDNCSEISGHKECKVGLSGGAEMPSSSYISVNEHFDAIVQDQSVCDLFSSKLDTVGAIALGPDGATAAAISSGGILLKHPGRLGHCTMFGAGIWAEQDSDSQISLAVSVSGCGEYLTRTHFAQHLAQVILNELRKPNQEHSKTIVECIGEFFKSEFLNAKALRNEKMDRKLAGAIILFSDGRNGLAEMLWVHNTPCMAIGYSTSESRSGARAFISRLNTGEQKSSNFVVSGCRIY